MNYWHMQLHPGDKPEWNLEREVLKNYQLIGMGVWEEDASQQNSFEKVMDIGDIVAIKRGEQLIALTEVIGDYEYAEGEEGRVDWFERRRKIKVLDWYNDAYKLYVSPRGTLTRCNVGGDALSTNSIIKWYKMLKMNNLQKTALDLLKYKKQIILQGPPGTGKTWLAKELAKDLTKLEKKGDPNSYVDELIKGFDPEDSVNKAERDKDELLLNEFIQLFPKGKLNQLNLETYCIGKGDRSNFCWWMERGLKPLGYYFPGSSQTYLIYWNKENQSYSKHGFIKDIDDDNDAMNKIAEVMQEVVNNNDIELGKEYFGDGFLLKILNSYYPDEYFPIYSERAIDNGLKILKFQSEEKLDIFEKNKRLNEFYKEKIEKFNRRLTSFEFQRLLWRNFDMKDGKDILSSDELISQGNWEIVQFHPAYSYEDFVRGIVAETIENEASDAVVSYKVQDKLLAEFAKRAAENPNGNYVLIIDEINRANLPSVLGELIYALEYRGEAISSLYKKKEDAEIILPPNLFLIGTMNTADRSVGHIDYALRRRFGFIDILPNEALIENEKSKNLFRIISGLFSNEYLSSDFKALDVMIGHSYFMIKDDSELNLRLEFEIKPILMEYVKDGVINENALEIINNLHV